MTTEKQNNRFNSHNIVPAKNSTSKLERKDNIGRRKRYLSTCNIRGLLIFGILQLPNIAYCDSGKNWFSNAFNSKGNNIEDVAVKISELPEKYNIPVRGVEFSPDGKYLAVRSADYTINIWDWQKRQIVHALEMAPGSNDGLTSEKLKFSPDGHWFVSCHSRAIGNIVARVWRTDTWGGSMTSLTPFLEVVVMRWCSPPIAAFSFDWSLDCLMSMVTL